MDPISTTALAAMAGSKALKVFEDVIYRHIYGVSKEELEAQNKEKAKDIIAVKEATRDFIVKSEVIKIQREYKNFGKTLNLATPYVISEENKIREDDDFFWNILEHSKDISNDEMQILIAKIIAGEYNNPGTYSMSTLQVLKSIDGKLLNNFTKILGVSLIRTGIFKDIFSSVKDMEQLDASYTSFLDLQNIGLICSNESSIRSEEDVFDVYIDKLVYFTAKDKSNKEIVVPDFYSLTRAGKEIAQHLNPKENSNFIDWLRNKYENRNFNIEVKK